ncbi:ubiquitin-protein ligase E3A-like [Stylophora pistillata]|uniref:ubiquitin-protein ligase E3A-like n=1 Tax=Stylophora pistillata TaxID=50429 RepID=UPI000C04171A|nr:ubiquitin-protein ligase E3A-like [Stylophora pistillata]
MSNKEKYSSDGKGRRNESRNCSQDDVGDDSADMKRAAEQKIKNYFFQLTDGCGSHGCNNEYCASSGRKQTSKDDAAALALQLFMKKARLCEPLQDKNHKVPTQEAPFLTEKSILTNLDSFLEEGSYKKLVHNIGIVFSSSESLNKSFQLDSSSRKISGTNVDIEAVRRMYAALFKTGDSSVENSLINSLVALSPTLEMELRIKSPSNDPNFLNQFVIIMENTMLQSPEYLDQALPSFLKAMALLSVKQQANLVQIWSQFSSQDIRRMVETLQQLVTYQVLTGPCATSNAPVQEDEAIVAATKVMKLLYYASIMGGISDQICVSNSHDGAMGSDNEEDPLVKELKIDVQDCRQPLVKHQEFVNDPLNDQIEVDRDYTYYKHEKGTKFSFLKYNFILSTATKSVGLFYDNRIRMYSERRLTILYSLVRGEQGTPYLKLKVRRDHLIEDALVNLEMTSQDNPGDLKKQLYVEFEGEQGIDEGGVSKEFFQLIVEQIFNPDYGMFTFDEAMHYCWFNLNSFETDSQFFLIGLVLGLAIYNNVILDVHFPMVVYKKLFGKKGTFEDLKVSHAGLAAGLQDMLDYKGDVEGDFMCSFTIGYTDMFGMSVTKELKKNGAEISVTNQNRQEFVDLYADFILNKSVERQFKAFRRGFDLVVSESPLKTFFRPDEVELLVSGCQDFDFDALEKSTEYDNGLSESSTVIRWFWEVVHEFTLEQKKQLLMFATGSDRIPVGGFSKLKLVIAKNGPDSDRLPTAHTCFNVLLLPEYSSKEKLKERLLKAITHAKGFGLL